MRVSTVCLIFCIFIITEGTRKKNGRGLKPVTVFEKIGECEGVKLRNVKLSNLKLVALEKGMTMLNADLALGEAPPPTLTGYVTVTKCKSLEDKECEHFMKMKLDMCSIFRLKDAFFSEMFNFKPPLQCPLHKNTTHVLRNATFDTEALLKFVGKLPPDYFTSYWKLVLVIKDGAPPNLIQTCVYGIYRFLQVRM